MTEVPSWPPALSDAQYATLKETAIDWALSHGLVLRAQTPLKTQPANLVTSNHCVIHAPFALFPTPFPRKCYQNAKEIQVLFNLLVHRISLDHKFLEDVMESLSKVDDFTGRLYDIYKTVRSEGISQTIELGIHRSDYLLHFPSGIEPVIQQVELNTIASSFASLSSLAGQLHKFLLEKTSYFNSHAITADALPPNEAISGLAKGIAKAHELYESPNAIVMMIVQPGERNVFDQRWIEYNLLNVHGIKLIRHTLAEVNNSARIDPHTKALYMTTYAGEVEVSVVYFRSGYGPGDYPTDKEWTGRLLIERSNTVKCPSIAYQLAGTKKVQQILANPGVVEQFIPEPAASKLRTCFTGLFPLDESPEGKKAVKMAMSNPSKYVMKPQREGGGNNIYGADIVSLLQKLSPTERNAYILMELIKPPPMKNILVREGNHIEVEVISELGIYGVWVSRGDKVYLNEPAGHLLRTKSSMTNEGGVAAGFAVIDSPLFV